MGDEIKTTRPATPMSYRSRMRTRMMVSMSFGSRMRSVLGGSILSGNDLDGGAGAKMRSR